MSTEFPQSIGPYHVKRSLGAGGMGEVFLAFDPRLKRQVAIKRIRPDTAHASESRARFLREAELAAGLNHPSIVHVHDLLTIEDVDHIVMEYVAGPSLRSRLRETGPMEVWQGLSIAHSLAQGLSYAHRMGVLHRDLKSENVLLSPEGQPKITDFGIACRIVSDDPSLPRDAPLTEKGTLIGTYRTMSPEQLCGDPVDARSDLFSFGVLLYEIFTGQSPFLAGSNRETMHRVLRHAPSPVHGLAPEVTPETSELIDHLLEKDPLMRPRDSEEVVRRLQGLVGDSQAIDDGATLLNGAIRLDATAEVPAASPSRERISRPSSVGPSDGSTYGPVKGQRKVVAAVVLAAALAVLLYKAWRPAGDPALLYVAVMSPEPTTTASGHEAELLYLAIRGALVRTLLSLDGVTPKTPADLDEAAANPKQMARAMGADELVIPGVACQARSCLVDLSRVRVDDDSVLWSDQVQVPLDEPLDAARSISIHFRGAYPDLALRSEAGELTVQPADYEAFLEVQNLFDTGAGGAALSDLLERATAIRTSSDQFAAAYLLEAQISVRLYSRTRDSEWLDKSLDLIREARELAPGDPYLLLEKAHAEIVGRRLDDAEATLGEFEEQVPGHARTLEKRAHILNARGHPQEALELFRRAAERSPSPALLINYARLAFQQGDVELARQAIAAHRRLLPNSWRAHRLLATIELGIGDPVRAIALYDELVEQLADPRDFSNLGLAHLLLERYDLAAAAFAEAIALVPNNENFILNLADVQWLQGRQSDAESLYRQVVSILDERGLTRPQEFTVRAQALAHLGQRHEAVAMVQEALLKAPGSMVVAYEAALVFALVGDRMTAVFHAEQAIRLGYQARWFRLPWFDDLKSDKTFQRLTALDAVDTGE